MRTTSKYIFGIITTCLIIACAQDPVYNPHNHDDHDHDHDHEHVDLNITGFPLYQNLLITQQPKLE